MPWLLLKTSKTHFFGDTWEACANKQTAPKPLTPKNGELSVWLIEPDKSNLERVLAALAANCDHLDRISWAFVDEQKVRELGIQVRDTPGRTPDDEVNTKWHRDLVGLPDDLSHPTLWQLAVAIHEQQEHTTKSAKQTGTLIKQGIEAGQIDPARVNRNIIRKLGTAIPDPPTP